jgi:hypothetical protein
VRSSSRPRLGREPVTRLEIDGIDLVGLDELLDGHRVQARERQRLEVLIGEHDVLSRRDLVPLHHLVPGDLDILGLAESLL